MKIWLFLLFATSFILSSCSKTTSAPLEYEDVSGAIEYTVLNFPSVKFDDIIWRIDGVLIAMQDESVRPLRQPYAFEGDTSTRYLDLEQDSGCGTITQYRFPTQLPDGRLGLIKWCVTDNAFTYASYMVAYDWGTGRVEQIVQNPLKHFDLAQCFSWNPDMTKGVQRVSNGLVGTLNWLTRIGPEPVYITLREGDRVWDLAKDYDENGSIEGGRVSCPSWSPNGDKVAVFISFDAMGVDGIPRLDKQMQLILITPETEDTESVLSGVYYPKSIQWSPDGRKIAFIGYVENGFVDYQGDEPSGVWVFDVEARVLSLIAKEGYFKDLSWSSDSANIAVIWCNDSDCSETEIRNYSMLY